MLAAKLTEIKSIHYCIKMERAEPVVREIVVPKAIMAASLSLQSSLVRLRLMKEETCGKKKSPQQVASERIHTPAALLGFQSSSSSYSS